MSTASQIITALSYHPLQQHSLGTYTPNNADLNGLMFMAFTINAWGCAPIKMHRLVCMPDSYQKDTEARSRLHYAKGGIYADIADKGVGVVRFSISGTTGWDPVRLGDGIYIDGAAAIKDLEETIAAFMDPDAVAFQISAPIRYIPRDQLSMTFFDCSVPVSKEDPGGACEYLIVPDGKLVSISRDARKPHLWRYTFSFVGLELLLNIAQNAVGLVRLIADAVGGGMPREAYQALLAVSSLCPAVSI